MDQSTLLFSLKESFNTYSSSIAVSQNNKKFTYKELDDLSDTIAGSIIKYDKENLPNETENSKCIGLYFQHAIEIVPAIIGVLKSGHLYVPLDVSYPEERLKYIINDINTDLILTDNDNYDNLVKLIGDKNIKIINIDKIQSAHSEFIQPQVKNNQYAYILYTSGSTGVPKGVIQDHKNIEHFCRAFGNLLRINKNDKLLLTTSFNHTVSVIDLFGILLKGGEACVYDVRDKDGIVNLKKIIKDKNITIFHSIPNLFRLAFYDKQDSDFFKSVRLVILGGENVNIKDFDLFKENLPEKSVFVNLYGSTELIIGMAYLLNKKMNISRTRIPLGACVEGVSLKVINNETDNLVDMFAVGEMKFISEYISPGYWKHNGNNINKKEYLSGDLGRYIPGGIVEFMGRKDSQIKLNGIRIELNEIETIVDSFEGIDKSIVKIDEKGGDNYIICFYKKTDTSLNIEELISYLRKKLPAIMIPSNFYEITEFPLNNNGKIDRQKLTRQISKRDNNELKLPTNDIEKNLLEIYVNELPVDEMSLTDNYFELGMNSIKISKIYLTINSVYPEILTVQDMFDYKTVQEIADLIQKRKDNNDTKLEEKTESFEF